MKTPNVLVACSTENLREELCEPRLKKSGDMSFVPPKYMYIKTLIPVVLDLYNVQYAQWSTVFRDAARANNLLHHIDPTVPAPPLPDVSIISSSDDDDTTLWCRQDAIVLSWIYATISPYLLTKWFTRTILLTKTWFIKTSSTKAIDVWAFVHETCQEYATTEYKKKRKFIHIDEEYHIVDDHADFISNLPDDLLVYVLFLVADMKTAARTCLVSKRWMHVWTHLKDLDFDDPETSKTLDLIFLAQPKMDKFVDRVKRVTIANQSPYLDTFRVKFPLNNSYDADINNWLKFAFGKEVRNLHLHVGTGTYPKIYYRNLFSVNPASILNTTLTSFHLRSVTIEGPFIQLLLTNCLNLQRLSLHYCKASADDESASSKGHQKLVVSSLKLKHLEFFSSLKKLNIEVLCLSAPNLTSFLIYETYKFDVEYRSVPSLVDVTFGGEYSYHICRDLGTLSGFSSQLEKLSIRWYNFRWGEEHCQFPNFANVQQLELVSAYGHTDFTRSTSLIEACPLLHTFKLKIMCHCRPELIWRHTAPNYAQENAIRCHQNLKVVRYLGYGGCPFADELAVCLARHAPMLQRIILDTREPRYLESLSHTTDERDRVAIMKRTELLAERIQRRQCPLDVVIL